PLKEEEQQLLLEYFAEEQALYAQDVEAATELLNVGEYPHAPLTDTAATAAIMQVVVALYNLEETLMKT
ncbi:MAG: hypothetical protein D6722_14395, partial [Bacteroidetes bacterium]